MDSKKVLSTVGTALLSVLVFCSLANAQVTWKKFSYFQNYGGLNDNLSTTEIADNESTDLQNIIFDTGGVIRKRFGYLNVPRNPISKLDTNVTGIVGLNFFKKDDGSRNLVAVVNNNGTAGVYKKTYIVGGGLPSGAWDNISAAGLPGSYTNNMLATMNVANNLLVFTLPGGVTPFKWTGSGNIATLTADPDVPTVSLNAYHKNILFLSGNTTNPSRVYFSALGDITDYTVTDFFDVETSDGAKVRAIVSAFNNLYIFKDNSIWRLSGTDRDSFVLEKMVDNVGTLSQQSVSVINGTGIYFVTSQNDIALYDGNYGIQFLSAKIRSTIGSLNFSRASNTLGLAFSTYKYVDFDYYVSTSSTTATQNDTALLFDTAYKAWTKFKGLKINAWCVADNDNSQNSMFFGDYNGYVYTYPSTQYFDGDVSTDAIAAFYQTKWFRYGDVALGDKYWRLLKTYIQTETISSSLSVEAKSDFESTGTIFAINLTQPGSLWDVAVWDVDLWGGQNLTVGRNEIEKGTNFFQLKYSNSNLNQGFSVFGFENFIESSDRI